MPTSSIHQGGHRQHQGHVQPLLPRAESASAVTIARRIVRNVGDWFRYLEREHALGMELGVFDEVADALRGLIPAKLGDLRCRTRRYGIKVWFGAVNAPREHYEAQVIGARHVEGATVLGLELGFHVEHPRPADNDVIIAHLLRSERRWRRALGTEATVGTFLGGADNWRRVSEVWPDPDLGDPDLGFEVAVRLVDYITALEPLRRASTG